MKISGEVDIKNVDRAEKFLSSYENLINCLPGVTEVKGREFSAKVKIGFLSLEAKGEVKFYDFKGNMSTSIIEVKGVGVNSTITSKVKIVGNKLLYEVDYEAQVNIKGLEKIVEKQANKISEEIITCTKQRINEG
ncbi:SRPBCC domain-containing protein [Stygiolobus caldivivus]|uniref:Carbon monoxide dehydrogenase subunit G n=1 Tax=Stygiolobus caldivivus TaxID=2824673 RepID=A0A8D5U5P3_9CREN|nr:SRPBCC domain-containing protein [Stygiolobus caldivivus]BCU69518.1 hypothetical protein KN1_08150 [Stygiolobus caldivivus]